MKDNFHVNEILEAVDLLLNSKSKKDKMPKFKTNQVLPPETENIISQAEKFIKTK